VKKHWTEKKRELQKLAPEVNPPKQSGRPYKKMALMIASPITHRPTNEYTSSLASLQAQMYCNPVADEFGTAFVAVSSCHLPDQRERLVADFLKNPFTHLLFIDSDMQFHPHVFHALAERKLPIVGCNYTFRRNPPIFVAVKSEEPTPRRCWSGDGAKGLEPVINLGFGMMLIERQVLEAIKMPRFLFEWVEYPPNTPLEITGGWPGYHATEDRYFCKKVIEAGFEVMCDHDASKMVNHCGSFPFSGKNAPWIPEVYVDNRVKILAPDGTPALAHPALAAVELAPEVVKEAVAQSLA